MDRTRILEFLSTTGKPYLQAAIILLAGYTLSRLAKRWLGRVLNSSRIREDPLLKDFFLRVLSLSILILATVTAFDRIGWNARTFIAGLGVTGLILGFGLKDTLANFAAGLLLLIYRPFRTGELIEVQGSQGVVRELTIVNMEMTTTDGVRVILPNSLVWGAKIINYSLAERRRMQLLIKVREEDAEEASGTILEALASYEKILKIPAATVQVTSLADNAATLTVWAWTNPGDFTEATSNAYLTLLSAFHKKEIPIL